MPTLKDLLIYAHMRNRVQRSPLHPTHYTAVQEAIDRVKRIAKQLRRLRLVLCRLNKLIAHRSNASVYRFEALARAS